MAINNILFSQNNNVATYYNKKVSNNNEQHSFVSVDEINDLSNALKLASDNDSLNKAIKCFLLFIQQKAQIGILKNYKEDKCSRISYLSEICIQKLDSSESNYALRYIRDSSNGYFTDQIQSEFGELPRCLIDFLSIIGAEKNIMTQNYDDGQIVINDRKVNINNKNRECPITLVEPNNPHIIVKKGQTSGANVLLDGSVVNPIKRSNRHPTSGENLSDYKIFKLNANNDGSFTSFEDELIKIIEAQIKYISNEQIKLNEQLMLKLFSNPD